MQIVLKYRAVMPDGGLRELDGPVDGLPELDGERLAVAKVVTDDSRLEPVRNVYYHLRKLTWGEQDMLKPKVAAPASITYPTNVKAGRMFFNHRQVSPWPDVAVLFPKEWTEEDVRRHLRRLADAQGALKWN